VKISKMLNVKMLFLILGHEECVIVVWRGYPTKSLPGYCMIVILPVKKKICGGLMVIFICMDISVIFLSSIALDLGHKRLALDWNLQHGI